MTLSSHSNDVAEAASLAEHPLAPRAAYSQIKRRLPVERRSAPLRPGDRFLEVRELLQLADRSGGPTTERKVPHGAPSRRGARQPLAPLFGLSRRFAARLPLRRPGPPALKKLPWQSRFKGNPLHCRSRHLEFAETVKGKQRKITRDFRRLPALWSGPDPGKESQLRTSARRPP
jgi:hypothetical protein